MFTQQQVDELKAKLIEACDKFIAEGGIVGAGVWNGFMVGGTPYRCPIGCLAEGFDYFGKANAILGLSPDNRIIYDFVEAFDGKVVDHPSMLHLLGEELRTKYITKQGT